MSAVDPQKALLSQEELDALLSELGQAADELVAGLHAGVPPRLLPIARNVVEFAGEQSRAMSTLYQRAIEFRMLDLQDVPVREYLNFMLPVDRVVVLQFEPRPVDRLPAHRPLASVRMAEPRVRRAGRHARSTPSPIATTRASRSASCGASRTSSRSISPRACAAAA